jgi:hypothetical protein
MISEDFEKIQNEDSSGLRRRYRVRNFVPRSQDILYGSKHPKERKNRYLCIGTHSRLPEHGLCAPSMAMCPEHGIGTPSMHFMHTQDPRAHPMCLEHGWMLAKTSFCYFLVGKNPILGPTSGGNSSYKYHIPHSQLFINNEAFQEDGKHYELLGKEFLPPHSKFL